MSDHIYKMLELTGTSKEGVEDAVNNALARAAKTVRNMHWVELLNVRGEIKEGRVARWQATMKVGFTLDE